MGKSHEESQREVRELFSKLSSWMEESKSKFSTLIDFNSGSITKGVDDLVEEVRKLQDELSIIKKEKNILIETVNCLNGEIKRYNERTSEKNQDAEEINELKPKVNKSIRALILLPKLQDSCFLQHLGICLVKWRNLKSPVSSAAIGLCRLSGNF